MRNFIFGLVLVGFFAGCAPYTQQVCTRDGSCATSSVIAQEEGYTYILSVEHFLEGAEKVDMRFPARNALPYYIPEATVRKKVPGFDLSLFRLKGKHGKAPEICSKEQVQNGDEVVAFSQRTTVMEVNGEIRVSNGFITKKTGKIINRDGLSITTTILFEHGDSGSPVVSKKHHCLVGVAAANVTSSSNDKVSSGSYSGNVDKTNFSYSRVVSAESVKVFLQY